MLNQVLWLFSYITCMVLTWQVPEIEVYISENSVFPSVNVWGVAMGSLETYTHVILIPGLHLFFLMASLLFYSSFHLLFYSLFLFPILFFNFSFLFFFIPYFLFPFLYSLYTDPEDCRSISLHQYW